MLSLITSPVATRFFNAKIQKIRFCNLSHVIYLAAISIFKKSHFFLMDIRRLQCFFLKKDAYEAFHTKVLHLFYSQILDRSLFVKSSKIIVVSNRAPTFPLSGGMAPAVKEACSRITSVFWFALEVKKECYDESTLIDPKKIKAHISESCIDHMQIKKIGLPQEYWDAHYIRWCNQFIWPLCHEHEKRIVPVSKVDFLKSMVVNLAIAYAISANLQQGDTQTPIWIHDYHHFFLPHLLRNIGVKNPIIFFNHIPLPKVEVVQKLDSKQKKYFIRSLGGLLDANAINFQTSENLKRFLELFGGSQKKPVFAYQTVSYRLFNKIVKLGHFPISVDTKAIIAISKQEALSKEAQVIADQLVAPYIFINFERCDYSKGIIPRLQAFKKLIEENPVLKGKVQIVIGAEPTRTDILEFKKYSDEVLAIIAQINSQLDWYCGQMPPVVSFLSNLKHRDVIGLFSKGNPKIQDQRLIGLVTPFSDGMNLVSKEFIAAQGGKKISKVAVLVLSANAGSAFELSLNGKGALTFSNTDKEMDPDLDIEPIKMAMLGSLTISDQEAIKRLVRQIEVVTRFDSKLWAQHSFKQIESCLI